MTMSESPSSLERFEELLSRHVDGALSADEFMELQAFLRDDAVRRERFVDQMLLDSLLAEEIGSESVTALVDLVSDSGAMPVVPVSTSSVEVAPAAPTGAGPRRARSAWKLWGGLSAAGLIALVAFIVGRWENSAFAHAATIVRAAVETHAAPVERVYLVEVASRGRVAPQLDIESRSDSTTSDSTTKDSASAAREVRVATQGDRFYVEMNRGQRQWFWGRDAAGSIWLTVGPRRAMVVEPDELGVPLRYISDLYTLELETLLNNFLKHCRLKRSEDTESTYVIAATPRYRWSGGWFRRATIEVDRDTKTVRRLVIERELAQQGPSTVTFTLVDSRPADEAKYRPEGHLAEPFRLLTRDSQPDNRRELLVNWFGSYAERWIKTPSAPEPDDGK
jgi:hypothetical protein